MHHYVAWSFFAFLEKKHHQHLYYYYHPTFATMPDHLHLMREALDTRPRGSVPPLAEIAQALGPFSSDTDGTETGVEQPQRRRRSRRRA